MRVYCTVLHRKTPFKEAIITNLRIELHSQAQEDFSLATMIFTSLFAQFSIADNSGYELFLRICKFFEKRDDPHRVWMIASDLCHFLKQNYRSNLKSFLIAISNHVHGKVLRLLKNYFDIWPWPN